MVKTLEGFGGIVRLEEAGCFIVGRFLGVQTFSRKKDGQEGFIYQLENEQGETLALFETGSLKPMRSKITALPIGTLVAFGRAGQIDTGQATPMNKIICVAADEGDSFQDIKNYIADAIQKELKNDGSGKPGKKPGK